ncbi:hypothetical protein OIU85_012884 [Salix viminalis]|uniref:Uncharacterized protein n=1 Tax=Salix viminalis TaxID=40686 RepID=A0A9Q0NQB6_SALVM|nr:hypothetical protein OIU85_012884 [Salix viminalis]
MDESSTGYYSILLLEDSLEKIGKDGFFLSDSEKMEGETKEGGMDGNKVFLSVKA